MKMCPKVNTENVHFNYSTKKNLKPLNPSGIATSFVWHLQEQAYASRKTSFAFLQIVSASFQFLSA
jgi:hypothetical protein